MRVGIDFRDGSRAWSGVGTSSRSGFGIKAGFRTSVRVRFRAGDLKLRLGLGFRDEGVGR